MALPYLVKYIYSNGSDEVIRRGKKIYNFGNVEIITQNLLSEAISFRIKDDAYATWYKVYINNYKDEKNISLRCSCPYNIGEICRHEVAALFRLQELSDNNLLDSDSVEYNQQHTVIRMKRIELKTIRMQTSSLVFSQAENFLRHDNAKILKAEDEKVLAEVEFEGSKYSVFIKKNEERNFDTSCDCVTETAHPLCVHKAVVFLQLLNNHGPDYFDTIRNWDKEKNKLLSLYGYSLNDDIKNKFEFTYKEGKPFLRVLDTSIKRVVQPNTAAFKPSYIQAAAVAAVAEAPAKTYMRAGMVLSYNPHLYPYIQVDAIQGEVDEENTAYIGKVEKLDLSRYINTDALPEEDKQLILQLRKLLPAEVTRYLNRNSPFFGIWENIVQQHDEQLPEETRRLIVEYLHSKYKKLFTDSGGSHFTFYLPQGKPFLTSSLVLANYSINFITPEFVVEKIDNNYEISCLVNTPLGKENISANEIDSPFLMQLENQFYLWKNQEDALLAEHFFPKGKIIYDEEAWEKNLQSFILPLFKNYHIHFENIAQEELTNVAPSLKVLLKEKGEYLLIEPVITYSEYEIKPTDKEVIIIPKADKILSIHRNMDAERTLLSKIENLHSGFVKTESRHSFALKGTDALKNNWFFLFTDTLKEMNIPLYGFGSLKKFRFNTSKPSTKIFISSHTDWFDAKVDIQFGDQKVTIHDIKSALANKQQYIQLGDGSLGILPEQWIQKYALLFRVGDGKENAIKLSRFHFSVIEELYEQRNEEEIIFQLEEKYENLRKAKGVPQIAPSSNLHATLRPYQVFGFQWLNYLSEIRWGGILADDMGLGKTIQTLSFLQYVKEQNGKLFALVVCPTTLMYNWENEIKKFTPTLSTYIHQGAARLKNSLPVNDADIVITTYGTLRSDIKLFTSVEFDYAVLDESQAIKNPSSKVAKAATLLKAANRLCLSGTPLQNNTFDIYAQMNFLNPGLLGSIEHFKQLFAIPIDKFGEKEQKEHLRKILFPFILRRTKEQVEKDLPEKTETILFCEMEEEQRKIYDAYRNEYRDKILNVIDSQGMQKSQLTILQGLMRLRQICDSPAIINDDHEYPNVSIKLEELSRELVENIGNHKALIFSQFLGMLALIKDKLKELGIEYEYFDGSTSALDREKAIQGFQNNENCRVFLISLKAGGVGLNLTAADYVYIVDPWWNPAVEQQAIDRTHRIGQNKNIFAYRMICKDTVEDKIIQLQERKRALAADIITDDSGIVKSLTRTDIEYLFS
ncbi:MAG: DEAD/DEAH box helicase [Chitinophagaceae bacterium]|nr:DEAD/DEAH box helicase [Chitinophagaceae bacterium]